jgi:hypothetical protein
MKQKHLSAKELALRWNMKDRTLEQWRWFGCGPSFLKLGGNVRYRLSDIERFEQLQMHHLADHIPNPIYAQINLPKQSDTFSQEEGYP